MKTISFQSTGARKALVSGLLVAIALCAVGSTQAQNLIPANADFESSTALSGAFSWPTTTTWARGGGAGFGITPYTDFTAPQSGSSNAVLNQFTADVFSHFTLAYVGQPDPLGGPSTSAVANLPAITIGQDYNVTFWANRWVDVVAPTDPGNMGFVDPSSASLPDARLTLQLYTSTGNDLSGGAFFGSNLAFNPVAGGSAGAYTQGAWTQYSTTFTADKTGFLEMFFKVKDGADTGYFGAGATGVKYGLDNVSVTAVPEPSTTAALLVGVCVLLMANRLRRRA